MVALSLTLTSLAFGAGDVIPARFTADGPDLSPPLAWEKVPEGTRSIVLIVDDPDAPAGTWVHWVLAGIPPDRTSLPEGIDVAGHPKGLVGAVNGTNSFGRLGYGGPSPPRGPAHRYYFRLYALDSPLDVKPGVTKVALLAAMKGHVLAEGELMGRYQRK
jgi:Raf kinase inhibitor-like YbhB/YbcL family protein